ncbi:MAG TPA: hypothetical protein VGD91_11500 [Trebonia sp.]
MADDPNRPLTAATVLPLLRRAATAVAVGRVGLGVTALVWPLVPARPWVGSSADELSSEVLARALGARDLALGLGALAALRETPGHRSAAAWYAAGALSDALDFSVTAAAWSRLPRFTRWLVAASAGGAALAGAAGTLAAVLERPAPVAAAEVAVAEVAVTEVRVPQAPA